MAVVYIASAQEQTSAERLAPQTRAGLIQLRRTQKSTALQPDVPDRVEQAIQYVKEHKVLEHVFQGYKGFRPRIGGLVTGSGFAAGPEYYPQRSAARQCGISRVRTRIVEEVLRPRFRSEPAETGERAPVPAFLRAASRLSPYRLLRPGSRFGEERAEWVPALQDASFRRTAVWCSPGTYAWAASAAT